MSKLIDPAKYRREQIEKLGLPKDRSHRLDLTYDDGTGYSILIRHEVYNEKPLYSLVAEGVTLDSVDDLVTAFRLATLYLDGVAAAVPIRHPSIRIFTEPPGKDV